MGGCHGGWGRVFAYEALNDFVSTEDKLAMTPTAN